MLLVIEGESREFVPINAFRSCCGLPPEFGLGLFMTKDYVVSGSIEGASAELRMLRGTVLDAVPRQQPHQGWLASTLTLQRVFQKTLTEINGRIGLRASEVEFAAMGFGEVCQGFIFGLLQAQMEKRQFPNFQEVYLRWLNSTIAISQANYFHRPQEPPWRIRLVRAAYGHCGLIIHTSTVTHYVHDNEYSCPVENFMVSLLSDVAACFVVTMQQNNIAHTS